MAKLNVLGRDFSYVCREDSPPPIANGEFVHPWVSVIAQLHEALSDINLDIYYGGGNATVLYEDPQYSEMEAILEGSHVTQLAKGDLNDLGDNQSWGLFDISKVTELPIICTEFIDRSGLVVEAVSLSVLKDFLAFYVNMEMLNGESPEVTHILGRMSDTAGLRITMPEYVNFQRKGTVIVGRVEFPYECTKIIDPNEPVGILQTAMNSSIAQILDANFNLRKLSNTETIYTDKDYYTAFKKLMNRHYATQKVDNGRYGIFYIGDRKDYSVVSRFQIDEYKIQIEALNLPILRNFLEALQIMRTKTPKLAQILDALNEELGGVKVSWKRIDNSI